MRLLQVFNYIRMRLYYMFRRAGIRSGLIAPVCRYPFTEVMQKYPLGRPSYRWGTLCAAEVAKELGYDQISVIEFGVAGGSGLVKLEQLAAEAQAITGVIIEVYGFDTGTGLPRPTDYRDLPQLWGEGDYKMDVELLKSRLGGSELLLGPVSETVSKFIAMNPAPVGFISFDMDLYSSTMDAFKLFEAHEQVLMPRVVCYFDDIMGYSHSDFTGERLAIHEFNAQSDSRKISKIYGLRDILRSDKIWTDMMFMFHAFDHSRYGDFDGTNQISDIPLN